MPTTDLDQSALAGESLTDIVHMPAVPAMSAFIGRGAQPYLDLYENLLRDRALRGASGTARLSQFPTSWHWPAFLLTIPWLFYRKMYTGGIILVALPVFLDHLLPGSLFLGSGLMIALTVGLRGKSWYLERALRRFTRARRTFDDDTMRSIYLERAGGVSFSAGIFGALIQSVTATVIMLDLLPPAHF
jgi:hypothetical protein